jgi:cell wall-associated NlpC family hydrolase
VRIHSKIAVVVGSLVALSLPAPTGAVARESGYQDNHWKDPKENRKAEKPEHEEHSKKEQDTWVERKKLEKRARSQMGTPYRSGGTSPGGFDCSGFTRWVFEHRGLELPHSSSAQFNMGSRKNFKRVWKIKQLKVGDLVFQDTGSGRVGHAGMYIGEGRFISSTSSSGVRVDSLSDGYWGPRWVGGVRTPLTQN